MGAKLEEESVPLTTRIPSGSGRPDSPGSSQRQEQALRNDEELPDLASRKPAVREDVPWLSLPNKGQLFLLALCRLSEPLSNTCLLPYIYYLMRSVVVEGTATPDDDQKKRISILSGILVATFPLAQLVTSMLWARWADTYGRRYSILVALLVSAIANLGFGFSRGLWSLMFWRTLSGLANGNVGVMRAMTAEIVRERKYQTKAFLLLPLLFNAGMVLGLLLGGVLADPVVNLSFFFGPNGIFNFSKHAEGVAWLIKFPYVLPAMWNWATLSFTFILALGGLKETVQGREDQSDLGLRVGQYIILRVQRLLLPAKVQYNALPGNEESALEKPAAPSGPPPRASIAGKRVYTRDVVCAMISFGLLPLHNSAFMHIFPIFLSDIPAAPSSKDNITHFGGGLGMHSRSIGIYLSLFGLCGIFLQLFIYPRVQKRLGTLGCFRISLYLFPITYFFTPFLALLPHTGFWRWLAVAVIAWAQIMSRTIAIPSTVILLTNSAPMKPMLGKIHGAGNMLASLARCIGPALGGWVYAKGMQNDMAGMVWWFYLMVVAFAALAWSFTMRSLD